MVSSCGYSVPTAVCTGCTFKFSGNELLLKPAWANRFTAAQLNEATSSFEYTLHTCCEQQPQPKMEGLKVLPKFRRLCGREDVCSF